MKITRDELLIAAFKLFMSVNYEKASFAELGKMLGMSKAGIFKYYKNKQELFIAVVDKFCFSAQNPRNKFTETNGTFAEFIDEYVKGVQRTMDMLSNLIGPGSDKVVQGKFSYHAQYFHFLFQLLQYDPNAKEKLHNLIVGDYAYWRTAIQRAINTGELRKDVDVFSRWTGYGTSCQTFTRRLLLIEMLDSAVRHIFLTYLSVGAKKYKKGIIGKNLAYFN